MLLILPSGSPARIGSAALERSAANPAQGRGDRVSVWRERVRAHQPGTADAAAAAAGEATRGELADLLWLLRAAQLTEADVKRGAVLHLDVALHVPANASGPLFRTTRGGAPATVMVYDGRREGVSALLTHLEFARHLLRELSGEAAGDGFVRLWYVASAVFLSDRLNFAELERHLAEARRVLPHDPEVLAASGYLHEMFAAPGAQSLVRARGNEQLRLAVGDERTNLSRAESYLRRAVDQSPDLVEARLRFGRVLSLQGRHADALPHLQIARDAAADFYGQYFALLFLGRALEALGKDDEARAPFEAAAALFPSAQSPHLALSRLALARGEQSEAARLLDRQSGTSGHDSDPWWFYDRGPGRRAERMTAALRAAVEVLEK